MGRDLTKTVFDPKNAQHLNEVVSYHVIQTLGQLGVRHFCLCPGGRNAPIIDLVGENPDFQKYLLHDERSAGFFAIGKIMATGEPCAVVVTSGTAVGELMPAVMEAYYSKLPLIIISADRPKRFKGSGAPQSAEQENIYGMYTPHFEDLEADSLIKLQNWDARSPCHLNLRLEESYIAEYSRFPDIVLGKFQKRVIPKNLSANEQLLDFLQDVKYPIIVVGALTEEERAPVKKLLLKLEVPCILETHSRLRNDPELKNLKLVNGDGALKKIDSIGYNIDGVLRIGGIPTTRLWRDTEYLEGKCRLLSVSRKPFSGSSWGSMINSELSILTDVADICTSKKTESSIKWLIEDQKNAALLETLYEKYPLAEQSLVHKISTLVPKDARIFLGTSLPLREWDMCAGNEIQYQDVHTVRGLNGIDGQISTFLGLMHPDKHNIGVIGDLTALYDMGAPFVLKDCVGTFTLFIINNGGGKIFQRLYKNPLIQNQHTITFEHWPKIFGMTYCKIDYAEFDDAVLKYNVVEVVPSDEQSRLFNASFR